MNQPSIRILVVDDETAIRRALKPPLAELGFQVAEAGRGEEALQMLRASLRIQCHDLRGLKRCGGFAPSPRGCPS